MHPLAEYPRPAMRRDSCEILNGPWQYAITQTAEYPAAWQGSILVPYSPEAPASGVGRTLQPGQWLHYHRLFAPPAGEGGRVLLHFGAVDYACAVQVNGHLAGGHRGGYWPFTLDITDLLNGTGRNSRLNELDEVGVVCIRTCALGDLKNDRSLFFTAGFGDTLHDLHVVDVESADGITASVGLLEHFGGSYQRHSDISPYLLNIYKRF